MNLECDEKILAGAIPAAKTLDAGFSGRSELDSSVSDRIDIAHSSSTITKGRVRAICIFTGTYTEIGRIAKSMQDSKRGRKPNR
ncbi:uncharacterized protein BDR25DRAFT_367783 [Lindgomyces ingoldianus]|uniref:Uncharacterized protein n=1 Tax=Lindgomyces ingoldianus TaxID=673940 RepID=A0ACB6QY90_9PLEO|nr:uncharacterized protein BDR25DRAFT_367783 [Lindgomyces ingoldianus]KAF2471886.1 hypothetical protein BDR25DRAFT_367783 [Lindgomyces ingoldianus]